MPNAFHIKQGVAGQTGKGPSERFVGDVFADIHGTDTDAKVNIGTVTFNPCARTNWHTHEGGQAIYVLHGSGWHCIQGEAPVRMKAGDVIWVGPGTTHWHGADKANLLSHYVVSRGAVDWHQAVTDEEYASGE